MRGRTRWNPLGGLARSWGHFVRRPRSTQIRTVLLVAAVIAGTTVWVASSPSGSSPSSASVPGLGPSTGGARRLLAQPGELGQYLDPGRDRPQHQRRLPGRGPRLAGRQGRIRRGHRVQRADQGHRAVRQADQRRRRDQRSQDRPASSPLRPHQRDPRCGRCARTGPRGHRRPSPCSTGSGTWTGDNQLCITQEGHTPVLSQWTTVTNWTQEGSPYLWWTGPDDAAILQATVNWGLSAGLLGSGIKVGVIAGDRASDQVALNQYLLPDLRRAGDHAGRQDDRRRPLRHRLHRRPGPPGDPAAAQCRRRHLGDPAHALQRLLPGAGGRDTAAVLPQAPAVGLRGVASNRRSGSSRSPTRRPSTARRA